LARKSRHLVRKSRDPARRRDMRAKWREIRAAAREPGSERPPTAIIRTPPAVADDPTPARPRVEADLMGQLAGRRVADLMGSPSGPRVAGDEIGAESRQPVAHFGRVEHLEPVGVAGELARRGLGIVETGEDGDPSVRRGLPHREP